ncbi:MAG: hypothetical protein WCO11_00010 [Sphingomonadales bacterium]|jgi:hypothetical protein
MIALAALMLALAQPAPEPPPRPPEDTGAEAVIQPDRGGVDDSIGRAAVRPLRDLNIVKPKVAAALAEIMAAPYDIRGLRTCRQLNGEINRMTALVGPDVDDPALAGHKGRTPVELLFDTAEGITGSLIPGQGIIRQITGANKAARVAAAARLAGQLRRSYVRGVMQARRCTLRPGPPPPG